MFNRLNTGAIPAVIIAVLLFVTAGPGVQVDAASRRQLAGFLSPPYYGTSEITSVFDHELPLWSANDGNSWTMHYDGVRDGAGARSSYDQHRGIDYWMRYEPVRATAPGTVARANWADPANHRASYGLHVRIDHADGFRTIYGHMSVLRVQQGDTIPAGTDEFERIIGLSGNTGLCYGWEGTGPYGLCTVNDPPSCGAHIHYQLEHNGKPENPYGWIGPFADPWSLRPDGSTSANRWLHYPSVTNSDVFPADAPLSFPYVTLDEEGDVTIDDGDMGFAEEPAGCWTVDGAAGWDGDYRHRTVPGADCTATWYFPEDQPIGLHHVFIHIPNDNVPLSARSATVEAARYTVYHTVSLATPEVKQNEIAIVNQWAYPNTYHTSRWVYAGTYYFDSNAFGTDYVRLESQALDSTGTLAADALRFVPVVYPYQTYLPLVATHWPPIPSVPVLDIEITGDDSYSVSWTSVDLAEAYVLQEATDLSFTRVVTRYVGADTSWAAEGKPMGTYTYRVKAVNAFEESGWSNAQQVAIPSSGEWQIIASQDFEGEFPGLWTVWDGDGGEHGEYMWSKRDCRPYAGGYSGWGVGGGAQGASLVCGADYPHSANSWLVYGPFDLEDALAGGLHFKLRLDTEVQNDTFFYGASVDGTYFYGLVTWGDTQGWVDLSLDLANVPTLGSLLGQSQVWVALVFYSNDSLAYPEGGYVDDIVLRKCLQEPCSGEGRWDASGSGWFQERPVMMVWGRERILDALGIGAEE